MEPPKPNREELIEMLEEMIKSYENVPPHGLITPITHYDFVSLMMLLKAILKE